MSKNTNSQSGGSFKEGDRQVDSTIEAKVYTYLGEYDKAYEEEDYEEALKWAKKAGKISPDSQLIKRYEGRCLYYLGRLKEAKKVFDKFVQEQEKEGGIGYMTSVAYADLLRDLGHNEEAEKYYLINIQVDPQHARAAMNNLAVMYKAMGKYEDAEKYYKRYLSLKPKSPDVLNNLGNLLCKMEKFEDALWHYNRAFKLRDSSGDTEAFTNYGKLLLENGEQKKAKKYIEMGLQVDPEDKALQELAKSI